MNFFLDTNVILDFLLERIPFEEAAKQIFDLAENKEISLFTSTHAIATCHYFGKKNFSEEKIRTTLYKLLHLINAISVDEEILKKSLKSHHKDFEDAIQIFCAHKIENLTAIVTRNLKDFSTAEVNVFAPEEALYFIKNNK